MRNRLIETREIDGHKYETWVRHLWTFRGNNSERTEYTRDGKRIARDAYRAAIGDPVREVERATCQVCERLIGVKVGVIAHHGYERPDQGYQTASCHGARRLSWEVDRSALGECIQGLGEGLADILRALDKMRREPFRVMVAPARQAWRGNRQEWLEAKYIEPGADGYERYQRSWFERQERQRELLEEEIARQQARYDAWKPAKILADA